MAAKKWRCSLPIIRTSKAGAIRSSGSTTLPMGTAQRAANRFYSDNFIDLMGEGLAEDLRYPQKQSAA